MQKNDKEKNKRTNKQKKRAIWKQQQCMNGKQRRNEDNAATRANDE